jgi:hypothetical protein
MEERQLDKHDRADETEEVSQESISEIESIRQDLVILIGELESIKKNSINLRENIKESAEWFKASASYLGSVYNTLERLEGSYKKKEAKLKRAIFTTNKEIALLKNTLPSAICSDEIILLEKVDNK